MTGVGGFFARTFEDARVRFVGAARDAGAAVEAIAHPARGLQGESLSTDVARLGPDGASKLLVLISGVHGVELYAGSGCQVAWLRGQRSLPADTAVLLVHAINPWGAAHYRRNTEDNVDLARNFHDFSRTLPENPGYEEIHAAVCDADRTRIFPGLTAFIKARGEQAFVGALMGGQYKHPKGFSYGGDKPVWSNTTIQNLLGQHVRYARSVCLVEYHSGLGPYGYGMAVTMHTGDALERTRKSFGGWVTAPRAGAAGTMHQAPGHTTDGYVAALPGKRITSIVLEYGTYPPLTSLPVLLDDHWLAHHGDPASDDARRIRAQNLEMHFPDDAEWRQAIIDRSEQVIRQALRAATEE